MRTPRYGRGRGWLIGLVVFVAIALLASACGDDDDEVSSDDGSSASDDGSSDDGSSASDDGSSDDGSSASDDGSSDDGSSASDDGSSDDGPPAGDDGSSDGGAVNGPVVDVGLSDAEYAALTGTDEIPDYVRLALDRVAVDLSEDQLQTALDIWNGGGGDTGTGGPLDIAYADGFGGNSWRRSAFMEFVLQALTYPAIGHISYSEAGFDPQQAISDMQNHIANGVDGIVLYADAGETLLPIVQDAQAAGIPVVPYIAPPGGEAGVDYPAFVTNDVCEVGRGFARASIEYNDDSGNYVYLGGTPGAPYSAFWQSCADEVYASSNMDLLGRADTNWTDEGAFSAASGFIAGGEDIDAWHYGFAGAARQILRAYESAEREMDFILTVAGSEQGLFCDYEEFIGDNPNLEIVHGSGGHWQVRIALTAIMDIIAGETVESMIAVPNELVAYESGDGCDPALPGDLPLDRLLPPELIGDMFS